MKEKALRLGPIAGVFGIWAVLLPLFVALLAFPELTAYAPYSLVVIGVVSLMIPSFTLARVRIVDAGVKGRARLFFGSSAMLVTGVANIAIGGLLLVIFDDPGFASGAFQRFGGASNPIDQLVNAIESVALSVGIWELFVAAFWVLAFSMHLQFLAGISTWFLIPLRVRRVLWTLFDIPLLLAFIFALWTMRFTPRTDGEITESSIALGITTLFALRAFARLLPPILDLVERGGFQMLVAARMLRARKSGFLTVIGLLSVLAVSFSSCTLSTTLSVMGGFRDDLQRKILGNNAHIVIDREYGTFEGWDPVLARVREIEGVRGASPFVAGEVMVTSASNLGGAMLRGIDPNTIGEVTDLPNNMRHGRIEYLLDPERLLHLSTAEMSGSLLGRRLPSPGSIEGDSDVPVDADAGAGALMPGAMRDEPVDDPDHTSLLRDIDRLLAQLPEEEESAAPEPPQDAFGRIDGPNDVLLRMPPPLHRPREVLPGIIVGQELARSLRLHVGDEVNVVSPLGDLGPAGPIPKSRPFRVAGIFYSGMYEYDMKVVYTDLETAQRFLSTGDAISGVEIRVDDWERAERMASTVASAISRPELRVRSWQEVNRNLFGALELEKLAMFITLGIAILVASFCIIGALVLMVQEKGREVGILKAMGAEDRHIIMVFMLQGLFTGIVGASTGLGLGWVVCFAAEHLGIVPLNPEVYYIDRLPIHTDPSEFLTVGLSAILVCLLATIYPAFLGSRLKPVDALRDA
jgi:lipoprotein-releasing system permease protein